MLLQRPIRCKVDLLRILVVLAEVVLEYFALRRADIIKVTVGICSGMVNKGVRCSVFLALFLLSKCALLRIIRSQFKAVG